MLIIVRKPSDKYVLVDMRLILYIFDIKRFNYMLSIPSSLGIADALKKLDSRLLETLKNALLQDALVSIFTKSESELPIQRLG